MSSIREVPAHRAQCPVGTVAPPKVPFPPAVLCNFPCGEDSLYPHCPGTQPLVARDFKSLKWGSSTEGEIFLMFNPN